MKVTLNLDTKGKQALYLLLLNHPCELEGFIEKILDTDRGCSPMFERMIQHLVPAERRKILAEVFSYDDLISVYDNFNKE